MGLNELFTFERARANKRPVSGKWSLLAVMSVGAAQHTSPGSAVPCGAWGGGGGTLPQGLLAPLLFRSY